MLGQRSLNYSMLKSAAYETCSREFRFTYFNTVCIGWYYKPDKLIMKSNWFTIFNLPQRQELQ